MNVKLIGIISIPFAFFILSNLASAYSFEKGHTTLNACVMKKFCNDNMKKCKYRCRVRWGEKLLSCLADYGGEHNQNIHYKMFKNRWETNCRIEKLKSIVKQMKGIRFNDAQRQGQRNEIVKSIQKELDRRFQHLYDNE